MTLLEDAGSKLSAPLARRLLLVAAALVFLAGVQLFVFSGRTAVYFAWTIANPLTAAFLGGGYWGSFVIEALAARERVWANARIAVPAVLTFTVLTLVVTLVYLELFHLGDAFGFNTQLVTWAWIVVYAVVPPLMVWAVVVQARAAGGDPPRTAPLPRWLAVALGVQGAVLLVVGVWLLIDPVGAVWPWTLTPLTGRAIGVWLVSLAVAAAHTLVERDLRRLRPAAWGYVAIAILQMVALLRYPHVPDWASASARLYLAMLVSMAAVGAAALRRSYASTASMS